jgi:hypothetical protein
VEGDLPGSNVSEDIKSDINNITLRNWSLRRLCNGWRSEGRAGETEMEALKIARAELAYIKREIRLTLACIYKLVEKKLKHHEERRSDV